MTGPVNAEYTQIMANYNQRMNAQIYGVCEKLSDEERKLDRNAYFNSIHGTLNHLILGDKIWMGRFTHKPFRLPSLDQILYEDFDELCTQRKSLDEIIVQWCRCLNDHVLAQTCTFESIVNPQQRSIPLWQAVMHFFNHQTHHRGQLTTLMSQCNCDPGVTDLLWHFDSTQETRL